jgi:hypothetical protein
MMYKVYQDDEVRTFKSWDESSVLSSHLLATGEPTDRVASSYLGVALNGMPRGYPLYPIQTMYHGKEIDGVLLDCHILGGNYTVISSHWKDEKSPIDLWIRPDSDPFGGILPPLRAVFKPSKLMFRTAMKSNLLWQLTSGDWALVDALGHAYMGKVELCRTEHSKQLEELK